MVVVCKARQAARADIPGMHRVRLAVKENMLSSPDRVSEADYISSIEVNGRGWVAESGDNIVAFAIGHATDGNIWALFVDPAYEGRGLGRRLNDTMVEWLKDQGLKKLWLSTDPDSRAAGFYTAVGWRHAGMTGHGEARFELDIA
jgi:GNAT superfamily N-acetyltransferase